MLDSLEIKNYRNLRHLTIPKLGRVNLVIGKNNTGKSSLLEAVAIYTQFGDFNNFFLRIIYFQMVRGEMIIPLERSDLNELLKNPQLLLNQINTSTVASLFYNREVELHHQNGTFIKIKANDKILGISIIDSHLDENNEFSIQKYPANIPGIKFSTELLAGIGNDYMALPIGGNITYKTRMDVKDEHSILCSYVPSTLTTNANNEERKYWGSIVLTPKEKFVIDALQAIEPRIQRFSYAGESLDKPYVQLEGESNLVPLRSMGDGINRILKIILSMIICENGIFLIDEFENGLHYSVQEKLWEIIFQLAEKLNIQVFATTHSNDTIKAFESIVNSQDQYQNSQLIKLVNIDGEIKQETADAEDLEIIVENNIDPR